MKKIFLFSLVAGLFVSGVMAQEANPMLNNALGMLDTPYEANTLEVTDEEELIIYGDGMDCMTFVEFTLAMSLCPEQGNEMQESDFAANLQKIRYRDGVIDGYTSRLHYTTDWIEDNVKKGTIEDITAKESPVSTTVNVSFMSNNPDKYTHLKDSRANIEKMAAIERRLSGNRVSYLPKENLPLEGLPWIKNGDIIAITTNAPGLDISHMGIAIYLKGNLHLLHASSKAGKVTVEKLTLTRQLARDKTATGIRVLRMKK
ncbi:MAG: DUF1460 domain-containing protein [Bacteroides sp.]|nr:DUF1460 domain-containing protein [Bacteroides sp.]